MHLENLLGVGVIYDLRHVNKAFLSQVVRSLGTMLLNKEAIVFLCLLHLFLERSDPLPLLDLNELLNLILVVFGGEGVGLRFAAALLAVARRPEENVGYLL